MSWFQRRRNSLAGKTFLTITLFSLIISAAGISFGHYLYYSSVRRDYRNRAWQMSRTANQFMDKDEALEEAGQVMTTYFLELTEEERDQLQDKKSPLLSRFDYVRTDAFEKLRFTLLSIQENNGGKAAFTAFLDPETNRRVFIADSDPNDSFCPPGSWDELPAEAIRDLTEGRQYFLDDLFGIGKIPATIINMEPYGSRCMAGTILGIVEGYPVYVFYDTDMDAALTTVRRFLWVYIAMMMTIVAAALFLLVRGMSINIVGPINQLAEAAKAYTRDRSDVQRSEHHFSELDIRTGDEIESLSQTMKEMEEDLGVYVQNLTRVTAERERISTEMSLATRIQADMLPNIYPAFPDRREFDIYGVMDPAKEVGGDFYDFFLADDDHLCMVMADVSGKGVPAALFMMISKILVKNIAMMRVSPAEALQKANHQICANNREEMFVTIWLGILQISTGKLVAANAGHEYPVLKQPDGRFEVFKDPHGLVIGAMDGMKYKDYEMQLYPGSKLFVYTDGVPEAVNNGKELFGMDRTVDALNQNSDVTPEEILHSVRSAVDAFADGAEQSDDITMLCLEYNGPAAADKQRKKAVTA